MRSLAPLLAPLALVLVTVLALIALGTPGHLSPVYSVAALRSHLAEDPRPWVGRTLLMRGEAGVAGCLVETPDGPLLCAPPRLVLSGAGHAAAPETLPLALGGPGSLLAGWRRLPVLGVLAPRPQALHWGVVASYRVRIRPSTGGGCGSTVCYEAVLLDAAP